MFYEKKILPSILKIKEELSNADLKSLPKLNIVILRSITIEPILLYLRFFAYKQGFTLNIKLGNFDNIYQDSVFDEQKIIKNDTDFLLIFSPINTITPIIENPNLKNLEQDFKQEEIKIRNYLETVINGIRSKTNASILFHSFENLIYPALNIYDNQSYFGIDRLINKSNQHLLEMVNKYENLYSVNTNQCLARIGANNFYDLRYWYLARAPYSNEAYIEIANEDFKYINSIKGNLKKCLILDCDNTLWGGIIGEDGIDGIELSETGKGASFYDFQKELLLMHSKGFLLAICSKNNIDDIKEVFEKHPSMLIKTEDIACFKVNWEEKYKNIKDISKELNIGTESLIFIDDNQFEIEFVRKNLPEVETLCLSIESSSNYLWKLRSINSISKHSITNEDLNRNQLYENEKKRTAVLNTFTDNKDFYKSLDMFVNIKENDFQNIERISQITLRTNQFNLTTKRYTNSNIKEFLNSKNYSIYSLSLKDKFGSLGLVGCCILKDCKDYIFIDTFLLSCRVIGRDLESCFLKTILNIVKKNNNNFKRIIAEYKETKKNVQVKKFYQKNGFKKLPKKDFQPNKDGIFYSLDSNNIEEYQNHIFSKIDVT